MEKKIINIPPNELDRPYKKFDFSGKLTTGEGLELTLIREGYHFPLDDIHHLLNLSNKTKILPLKRPLDTEQLLQKLSDKSHKITFAIAINKMGFPTNWIYILQI